MRETLRKILIEVRPHTKKVIIIALTGVLYSACYARLLYILKDLNESFEKGQSSRVADVAFWAFGLALVVALSRYFHIYLMNFVAELVSAQYRRQLQEKFLKLNLTFHAQFESGSAGMLTRTLADIRIIQDGLRMLADFFREPLFAVFLLTNLFLLNWELTAYILVLLPVVILFLKQISRSLRKYLHLGQENLDRLTGTIKESLDGVRIIQSFNLEKEMQNRLDQQLVEYTELRRKVHSRVEIMGPVSELLATGLILAIFFYFSSQVSAGQITIGAVLSYIATMLTLNIPIKKFQESYVRFQETIVAARRVYAVLEDQSYVPQSKNPLPFPLDWKVIEYRNVGFSYDKSQVLKNINLKIQRGQQIAFVGASGSGKSTIVNLLERFYDPTSGEILIDGIPIDHFDLRQLRQNIALVTQDVFLFNDTVEKNILAGNSDRPKGDVKNVSESAHAHDFIERLPEKYQSNVGERGGLLSGGEKQRISIARALFKDSSILILDEATSALDSASEIEVQRGLDLLSAGRTSLIIAHRLSTVRKCDCIYVLKSGAIVESGTHEDLLKLHGEYQNLFKNQSNEKASL